MPEGRIVSMDSEGGGGVIRPTRRRADIAFTADGVNQEGPLSCGEWVLYQFSDPLPQGRRVAVNVRRATAPAHGPIQHDPRWRATWRNIEKNHTEYGAAVERRWERGELTLHQRAGLLVDAEYERLTLLAGLIARAASEAPASVTSPAIPSGGDTQAADGADAPGAPTPDGVASGAIVTLKPEHGFGFVRLGSGVDVYFHASDVAGGTDYTELRVGDRVAFRMGDDARGRGPRAIEVRRLAPALTVGKDERGTVVPRRWPLPMGGPHETEEDHTVADWGRAS